VLSYRVISPAARSALRIPRRSPPKGAGEDVESLAVFERRHLRR
jgi:hypothetical protein